MQKEQILDLKQGGELIAQVKVVSGETMDTLDFIKGEIGNKNTISWRMVEWFIKEYYGTGIPIHVGRVYFTAPDRFKLIVVKQRRKPMKGMEMEFI